MSCTSGNVGYAERHQLERFVDLLGAYSALELTTRVLDTVTDGSLTPAQLEALTFIARHGGCSTKTLSEGLRISIPSATRSVDRLVRKQLVDRRESGVDRRLVMLTATPAGEALLHAVQQVRVQRLADALGSLTPAEGAQLLTLLERFLLVALNDEHAVAACCLHCGTEHDGGCVVNAAHTALLGRPVEHP
jgi:DNA-binding MarR family transcriptional regulator